MSLTKFIVCVNEGENSIKLLSYIDKYINDINKKNGMVEIQKIVNKNDIEIMKKQGLGTPFMIIGTAKIVGRAKIVDAFNAFLGLESLAKAPAPRRKPQVKDEFLVRDYMDRILEDEDEENSDDESRRNKKRAQRLEEFQKRREESSIKRSSRAKKVPVPRRKKQEELEPPEEIEGNESDELEQSEDIINMAKSIPGTDDFDRKMLDAFQI